MRKSIWAVMGVLVLAMMLLVACGGADDSSSSAERFTEDGDSAASGEASGGGSSSGGASTTLQSFATSGNDGAAVTSEGAPPRAPEPEPSSGSDSSDAGSPGGNGLGPVVLQVGAGRIIVFTASIVVEVEDVPLATQQAQQAMAGLGGLVFGQDTTTEPFPRTVLTFKVLPEDFQEALDRLAALGDLESQQVSSDDVTERVVDLESRIVTAAASVDRLREFLSNATDLEGVAQLEAQLLLRETDLERLRGQLRTIQDQAALATIFLTLVEPAPDAPEAHVELVQTAYLGTDEGDRCPGDDELSVDEGEAITICVSVENTGNLSLIEIEVRDVGLDLDEDDFVVLEGSLEGPLEPGETLVGYFDATAELSRFASPRFSAVVVDEDGDPIRIPVGVNTEPVELDVTEDTSVPSFTDGLSGSWESVQTLGRVGVLALGVAIPFFWVPLIVFGLIWTGRRMTPPRPRTAPTAAASEESETFE